MTKHNLLPTTHQQPELMAPAGDWTMLRAAVKAGANAVYFGVDKLNMRAKAKNFNVNDLPEISRFCKQKRVKTYLTLNTIVFEDELEEAEQIIKAGKKAKIDRIICSDLAVAELCSKHKMQVSWNKGQITDVEQKPCRFGKIPGPYIRALHHGKIIAHQKTYGKQGKHRIADDRHPGPLKFIKFMVIDIGHIIAGDEQNNYKQPEVSHKH